MAVSKHSRQQVFTRDNYTCGVCGKKIDPKIAQVSHIKPLARGGTSDLSNLQTVCPMCHYGFDRVLNLVANPSRELARGWITAFLKAPVVTACLSAIAGIVISVGAYVYSAEQKKEREAQRASSGNYLAQLNKLNETEQRLRELISFVDDQRQTLKQTEDALTKLRSQRDSLAPLVQSQKVVVDALFAAQEERNQKAVKRERWVGFGFGVASSIIASTLVGIATFFLKRRTAKKVDDETEEDAGA